MPIHMEKIRCRILAIARDGNIVIKGIYGQIMVDEYPPM